MSDVIKIILVAFACPLVLPVVIDGKDEEKR